MSIEISWTFDEMKINKTKYNSYVLVETMKTEAYQNAMSIGITQYHYIYNILTAVNQFSGNNSTFMIPQKFWVEKH